MRTLIAGLFLSCLILVLGGCGKSFEPAVPDVRDEHGHPEVTSTVSELAPWEIRLQTACSGDAPDDQCRGRYGFTLKSDGFYEVGPGPNGQKFRGVLEAGEMKVLTGYVHRDVSALRVVRHCAKDDSLRFTYDRNEIPSCDPEVAAQVKRLIDRYYPDKFPNPCVDATAQLEKLYDDAVVCDRDEDCGFIGSDYLPMSPWGENNASIVVDDCSYIQPLSVANSFKAVSLQRELLTAREHARSICGENFSKPSCAGALSIAASHKNQLCLNHQCQIRTIR